MKAETTGERLREARRNNGMSAEDLGRRAALELGRDRPISASAVRNQENGTNGIPVETLEAYSKVLKVPAGRLLWGEDFDLNTEPSTLAEARRQAEGETGHWRNPTATEIYEQIAIYKRGLISGNWLPIMVDPLSTGEEDTYIHIRIPGWHADADRLFAYEVLDRSLEPYIRKGTVLIVADADNAWAYEGALTITGRWRGGDIVYAVRKLKFVDGPDYDIDLVTLSEDPKQALPLVRNGEPSEEQFVDWIVICTIDYRAPSGRAVVLPQPYEEIDLDAEAVARAAAEIDALPDEERWARRREQKKAMRQSHKGADHKAHTEGVRIERDSDDDR
jgi:transcriptional regulator with XRE-family HTH domain